MSSVLIVTVLVVIGSFWRICYGIANVRWEKYPLGPKYCPQIDIRARLNSNLSSTGKEKLAWGISRRTSKVSTGIELFVMLSFIVAIISIQKVRCGKFVSLGKTIVVYCELPQSVVCETCESLLLREMQDRIFTQSHSGKKRAILLISTVC
jgi:hypothetical protein